jgi:hypothetical protein
MKRIITLILAAILGFGSAIAQTQSQISLNLKGTKFEDLPDSSKAKIMEALQAVDGLSLEVKERSNNQISIFRFDGKNTIKIDSTASQTFFFEGNGQGFSFGNVPSPPPVILFRDSINRLRPGFPRSPGAPLDSVNINIGNSRIAFVIQDREDLEELSDFDLNLVVENLQLKLDTLQSSLEEGYVIKRLLEAQKAAELAQDQAEIARLESAIAKERAELAKRKAEIARENAERNKKFKVEWDFDDAPEGVEEDMVIKGDDDWNAEEAEERRRRNRHMEDFFLELGFNQLGTGDEIISTDGQFAVKTWGSWMVGLNPGGQLRIGKRTWLGYYGGISWYNFKFSDTRTQLSTDDQGIASFTRIEDNPQTNYNKSKLTIVHLNASLLPMINLSNKPFRKKNSSFSRITDEGIRIGLGPYAGYKIDSYTKIVTEANSNKQRNIGRSDYSLENFRYGLRGVLGLGDFDFFVNYDLNDLFEPGKGPDLNAVSFGLMF